MRITYHPFFSIPKHNNVEGEEMISMINILLGSHNLFLELFSSKIFFNSFKATGGYRENKN